MKKNIQHIAILLCALLLTTVVQAQVKVGDNPTSINPNSVLEIESTNKGLLLPRVTLSSTTNFVPLATHVEGMVVYNTATAGDVTPGYYYNDGTQWVRLANAANVGETNTTLALDSTTGLLTYTNENNNNPVLRLANIEPWFGTDNYAGATENTEDIYTMGKVGIGATNPGSFLHIDGATVPGVGDILVETTHPNIEFIDKDNTERWRTTFADNRFVLQQSDDGTFGGDIQHIISSTGANRFVGIGLLVPTQKLDVNGKVRVRDLTGADLATDVIVTADATTGVLKEGGTLASVQDGDAWGVTGENQTSAIGRTGNVTIGSNTLGTRKFSVFSGVQNQVTIGAASLAGSATDGLLLTSSTSNGPHYHTSTSGENKTVAMVNISNDALYLGTNNLPRFRIDEHGQINFRSYLGTNFDETTPNYLLSTNGTTGDITKTSIADLASATADGDAWGVTGEDQTSAITRTGNVGIGTLAPTTQLEIENSNNSTFLKLSGTGVNNSDWLLLDGQNGSSHPTIALNRIQTNRTSVIRHALNGTTEWAYGILYNGGLSQTKYGIGKGTNISMAKFTIDDNGQLSFIDYTGTNFDEITPNYLLSTDGTTGDITKTSIADLASATADGDAWGVTGENQTSAIGRTGNVGIGIATPSAKTHIVQNTGTALLVEGSNNNSQPQETVSIKSSLHNGGANDVLLKLETTTNTGVNNVGFLLRALGDNHSVGTTTDLDEIFGISGTGLVRINTNQLVVQPDGDVGINTASPSARLDVRNTGTQDILNLYDDATEVLSMRDGGQLRLNNYTGTNFDATPTAMLGVDANGNVIKTPETKIINGTINTSITAQDASTGQSWATISIPHAGYWLLDAGLQVRPDNPSAVASMVEFDWKNSETPGIGGLRDVTQLDFEHFGRDALHLNRTIYVNGPTTLYLILTQISSSGGTTTLSASGTSPCPNCRNATATYLGGR